jgi:hypothetical protein
VRKRIAVRLYISFHWCDFPETVPLEISMHALQCKFGCYWPVIKGTLHGEQRAFSYLSQLPLVRFPSI